MGFSNLLQMHDRAIVEEILLIGDYFYSVEEVLNRDTTEIDNEDRIITLDLSNLGLDELSPTIVELEKLEVLNIKHNAIEYLPIELKDLPVLRKLLVAGNPLDGLPKLSDTIEVDVSLNTLDEVNRSRTQKVGLLPDKVCSWCNKAAGYRKEVQRTDSKWGWTTHVSLVMVCLSCSYMHQFYSGRSLFDFE